MSEAATDTICAGATSMYSMRSGVAIVNSLCCRHEISTSANRPSRSSEALAWAMVYLLSSIADRYSMRSVTLPSATFR